ncbi:LmeA family phospholipid-binding protein [Cellulomonas pakistanensis]|uniref:DUF2993 domain-containing protein n=1 Tax=Cellulomonas pakistanensis TaxID=992287 RepID=A0A919U864_9CELL|nr:DUF2993 domain-containing protein [Cellulomonas pakistanensis]GIG37662.1 hypothetical protein Cpa01nite_30430 [Cellulomonas pakistanensis]
MTRTRSPRRRVGCAVGLALAVVVLVGGTVLADRVTHGIAQDVAADAVRSQLGATDPDVSIAGFPFLTQLARGTLDDVHLTAPGATLRGLDVTNLDVTATGVAVQEPRGAEHVVATATVPTATLEALLRERTGWDLTLATEGEGLVAGGAVAGIPVAVGLTLAPAGADGLTATITSASLGGLVVDAGVLPDGLASRITEVDVTDQLPEGARVTGATVRDDGLHVRVELDDVTLDAL